MRAKFKTKTAPVRGLSLNRPISEPRENGAEVVENWFPTLRGARVRGGKKRVATLPAAVRSIFSYRVGASSSVFAATDTEIHDITALDPETPTAVVVSSQTAGYYSAQQFGTVGQDYLYVVNGADLARLFDGASWTAINGGSTPAITNIATSTFSQVWRYRNRLFFVEGGTFSSWYLPVDSVGGAAAEFSLAGVFQRGGALLLGATWSLDSGDGIDDRCVFISTEGEIAVYEGSDPSSASDWRLVGVYEVSKPLGINATMQAGGDLLIATLDGIVPLSQVIAKDPAALSLSAVTQEIEPLWGYEASRVTSQVELIKWAANNLAIVVLPESENMLTVNLQNGAWATQPGWQFTCGTVASDLAIAGQSDGKVFLLDEGGTDDGVGYVARYCGSFSNLGYSEAYKIAQMIRPKFLAPQPFEYASGVSTDFTVSFDTPPPAAEISTSGHLVYDEGNWNEGRWFSQDAARFGLGRIAEWCATCGAGTTMAPTVQITSNSQEKLLIELVDTTLSYEVGGIVV